VKREPGTQRVGSSFSFSLSTSFSNGATDSRRRTRSSARRIALGLLSLFSLLSAQAADLPPDQIEFFEAKIRPILVDSCYKCHSVEAGKSKGSLVLDSRDGLLKGGDNGPVVVAGDPDKSLLIQAVRYGDEDLEMPPKKEGGKLSSDKIAALEAWVKMGAPDPRTGAPMSPAHDVARARREHWAYQPLTQPELPAVKNSKWVRTPVDSFVLANLEKEKLKPAPEADKRTLLRRLSVDLTGLPPTPEEVEAFEKDRSATAYEQAVDRLLASPRYGERWGRFWLDVARYSDTKGYLAGNEERRYAFSHTYRDYVIQAFNEDKPYDQFIVEQLAADRIVQGEDKSALAAMGFLTLGRRFLNNQNDIIDDRIDVVTRGLMGLTVSCARCHDHKFDPVPTEDYYSLHGVFASSEEPGEKPLLRPLVDSPDYQDFLKKRARIEDRIKAKEEELVAEFLKADREKTGDYLLAAHDAATLGKDDKFDVFAGERKVDPTVLKRWQPFLSERAKQHDPVLAPWFAFAAIPADGFAEKAKELSARFAANADAAKPLNPLVAQAFTNTPASLKDVAAIYNRLLAETDKAWRGALAAAQKAKAEAPKQLGDADREGLRQLLYAEGRPANLSQDEGARIIRRQISDKVSGLKREIEALDWTSPGAPLRAMALADRDKPHDSRVFIRGNQGNLGADAPRRFPVVLAGPERKPFTDGSGRLELARAIASPDNPLTARVFVNRVWGWHFGQALVRTPSDFGVRTEAPVQLDLLNWLASDFIAHGWSVKHLHRQIVLSATYRESANADQKLLAADPDGRLLGRFNRHRAEFEAMRDTLLAVAGTLDLKAGGLPDDITVEPFTTRRTVYAYIDRQNLPGIFRTFDLPNPDVSSPQRFATTVPQQALFMMNSPFVQEQARALAARLEAASPSSDRDRVTALYRLLYQRPPERAELNLALKFLEAPKSTGTQSVPKVYGWQPGYGEFDAEQGRIRGFMEMTVKKDGHFSPAQELPAPEFSYLNLTAQGGHPGPRTGLAAIRRWVSPVDGTISVGGKLKHPAEQGDGVRGRIVSSLQGKLAEALVHHGEGELKLAGVRVRAGESIDFAVDCVTNDGWDSFDWAPEIVVTAGESAPPVKLEWSARGDFGRPVPAMKSMSRLEQLAQVLMLSNEMAFIE
jgi:hypothetical protein